MWRGLRVQSVSVTRLKAFRQTVSLWTLYRIRTPSRLRRHQLENRKTKAVSLPLPFPPAKRRRCIVRVRIHYRINRLIRSSDVLSFWDCSLNFSSCSSIPIVNGCQHLRHWRRCRRRWESFVAPQTRRHSRELFGAGSDEPWSAGDLQIGGAKPSLSRRLRRWFHMGSEVASGLSLFDSGVEDFWWVLNEYEEEGHLCEAV